MARRDLKRINQPKRVRKKDRIMNRASAEFSQLAPEAPDVGGPSGYRKAKAEKAEAYRMLRASDKKRQIRAAKKQNIKNWVQNEIKYNKSQMKANSPGFTSLQANQKANSVPNYRFLKTTEQAKNTKVVYSGGKLNVVSTPASRPGNTNFFKPGAKNVGPKIKVSPGPQDPTSKLKKFFGGGQKYPGILRQGYNPNLVQKKSLMQKIGGHFANNAFKYGGLGIAGLAGAGALAYFNYQKYNKPMGQATLNDRLDYYEELRSRR